MLELYQFESCPYCARVRAKLSELELDWISHTAPKGSQTRRELGEKYGKEMVPFLIDPEHNVQMYESDDIVEYLEKTYGSD